MVLWARESTKVGLDEQDPGRPVLAGDGLGDRLGRPGQGARAQVEAGDQPPGDGRGGLGQGAAGAAAEVGDPVARAGAEQPGQPAVPARHLRLDHGVDVVRFAGHASRR
jgi:hypothetical protein